MHTVHTNMSTTLLVVVMWSSRNSLKEATAISKIAYSLFIDNNKHHHKHHYT